MPGQEQTGVAVEPFKPLEPEKLDKLSEIVFQEIATPECREDTVDQIPKPATIKMLAAWRHEKQHPQVRSTVNAFIETANQRLIKETGSPLPFTSLAASGDYINAVIEYLVETQDEISDDAKATDPHNPANAKMDINEMKRHLGRRKLEATLDVEDWLRYFKRIIPKSKPAAVLSVELEDQQASFDRIPPELRELTDLYAEGLTNGQMQQAINTLVDNLYFYDAIETWGEETSLRWLKEILEDKIPTPAQLEFLSGLGALLSDLIGEHYKYRSLRDALDSGNANLANKLDAGLLTKFVDKAREQGRQEGQKEIERLQLENVALRNQLAAAGAQIQPEPASLQPATREVKKVDLILPPELRRLVDLQAKGLTGEQLQTVIEGLMKNTSKLPDKYISDAILDVLAGAIPSPEQTELLFKLEINLANLQSDRDKLSMIREALKSGNQDLVHTLEEGLLNEDY